jgi:hypothetical protein
MTQHNEIENSSIDSRIVEKMRIIVGILGEIDSAGAVVMLSATDSQLKASVAISCDFRVPFETSILTVLDQTIPSGHYKALVHFAGQRLKFDLIITSSDGICELPTQIQITDLRRHKRRRFGPEVQFAEIYSKHGVVMATPIDISQTSIALVTTAPELGFSEGDTVHLNIRGDTASRDIFSSKLEVHSIAKDTQPATQHSFQSLLKTTKILLSQPEEPQSNSPINLKTRRSERQVSPNLSLIIGPLDDHLGNSVRAKVTDLSLTGLRISLQGNKLHPWISKGLSIQFEGTGVTATIIRHEGSDLALTLNGLDETHTLKAWTKFLKSQGFGHGFHHSQAEELSLLLTESGLLKGSRRKLYGHDPSGYLPPDQMTDNPLLYHRVITKNSTGEIMGHMSISRLADDQWYFQEGAHLGGDGPTYKNIYSFVIQTTRNLARSNLSAPRFLSGLYHENVKSGGAFGAELFTDSSSRIFPLFQASIKKICSAGSPMKNSTTSIHFLLDFSAEVRRSYLSEFNASLCEAFVGVNGEHARLNAELAKLGPYHEAKTVMLKSNTGVFAIAYRLKSYYALNATGVMNSLFMIVKPQTEIQDLVAGIRELVDNGFSFGTDDAAIIVDGPIDGTFEFVQSLPSPRKFTFFMIDNILNKEFLGASVESEDSTAGRKKKNG